MTAVGYAQPVSLDKVTKLVAQFGQVRLARRLEDATPPKSLDERITWVSRVQFQLVEYLVAAGFFLLCFKQQAIGIAGGKEGGCI